MGGDWIIPTLNDCADLTKCVPDPDNCLQCKKVPIYSVANGI